MQFYRISKGKFVPCNQNQAQFVRNAAGEMVGLNAAGLPRMSRPLADDAPKGRVHVFDVNDKTPFSSAATVTRPERAAKIDAVRERREQQQRTKAGANVDHIAKGEKSTTTEPNSNAAATIAEFFALLEKTEMQVNSGLFNAANEGIASLRALATSVPNKQRAPLRNALRLLVLYKSEAVKSDREKRKETARHERTAKSAERADAIKKRRDGIAAAKANKAANTFGRGPAPFYTAKTGQAVARQLAERRNLERARL